MTDLSGRVTRNALWLVAGEAASKVASVLFVVVVARALGVREYGWFVFATAFVPLFLIVGSLGLHQASVRAMVRDRSRLSEVFSSGLALRASTGVLAVVLSALFAPLVLHERLAVVTVVVVGSALLLDSLTSYVSSVFEAHGDLRRYAVALVINRIGSAALALAVYLLGGGLAPVLAVYVLGSAAGCAYAGRSVRRDFPEVALRSARRRTAVALLRQGAPLGVAALLNMALLRFDTIMVAVLLGSVEVGLYGAAFRFYESFLFVAFALGDATFPSYARSDREADGGRTVQGAATLAVAAYVPLFVLSLFAAPWAVELLFGERYAGAADAVPWLTLATVFFAFTYQARSALVGGGGRSSVVGVAAVALAVNVVLNLLLIPRTGIDGAALATAVASGVEALLTCLALRRRQPEVRFARGLVVPVLAGAATAAALAALELEGGPAVLAGTPGYLLALGLALPLLPAAQRCWVRDGGSRLLRR